MTETVDNLVNDEISTSFTKVTNDGKSNRHNDDDSQYNDLSAASPKLPLIPLNTNEETIPYISIDSIDLLRSFHRCVSDGKNIYFAHTFPDLFIMPIGTNEHNPANIDNPEGIDVFNVTIDTHGRIHLLVGDYENIKWFIWRLDESFQIDKVIDISAYFDTNLIPIWFQIDKNDTYYLK
jgi:hypothetical protein